MFQLAMALSVALGVFITTAAHAVSLEEIDRGLQSPAGIEAEIHGVASENGYYVLAFRDPGDFFNFRLVSLVANHLNPDFQKIQDSFKALGRHDLVRVKGRLNDLITSPQPHALIDELTVVTKFVNPYPQVPPYQRATTLPDALLQRDEAVFKVHALFENGQVLVVEFGDAVIPVYVTRAEDLAVTQGLYRNDIIRLKYTIARDPKRPVHLRLQRVQGAVAVVDSMVSQHETSVDMCGLLIMFPKSPQVIFNVFAMQVAAGDELTRNYTLVNFSSPTVFQEIRLKAQAAWDANLSEVIAGRNYFINPKLKVCAKGKGNVQDPNQANPQILIETAADLTVQSL